VVNGNVFEQALGWLLGYASRAVQMQQVAWMDYFNTYYLYGTAGRPPLPVLFVNFVGTDVDSSPFDPDSYCGDYSLNLGLEITQNWLDPCSDGFLECSSQMAAGALSLPDIFFTFDAEPASHNQSRRKCFGVDLLMRVITTL
jgi:hypothetical protein